MGVLPLLDLPGVSYIFRENDLVYGDFKIVFYRVAHSILLRLKTSVFCFCG